MPVVAINKKHMSENTWDDIMTVISWSFQCLASGQFPTKRHSGTAWNKTDSYRKRLSGKPIGMRGILAEVRADWQFLALTFKFPSHNLGAGCCWRCKVTPKTLRDFSLTAPWRQPEERLDHWGLMARWQEQGVEPSPLLACPFLVSSCFAIDWLHAVDQGVGPDFLGNLFWHVLPLLGPNKKAQVSALFLRVQEYYKAHPAVDSRYDDLTVQMLKKPKCGPKLRGRAAEVRGLVPFGVQLSDELLTGGDQISLTICRCAKHLLGAYDQLSSNSFSSDSLQLHVRQFCVLYSALEDIQNKPELKLWRVKPKFHLFCELAIEGNCPSLQWTYRDEDFGGTAAKVSRRRGGKNSVLSMGTNLLSKFLAKSALPNFASMT